MLDSAEEDCRIGTLDVKILSDIASGLSVNNEGTSLILNEYDKQLKVIHDLLVTSGHAGLLALSDILSQGLHLLIEEERSLTKNECEFLLKIPEIFSEYIFIPSSKISDAHLLSHLKNKDWIRPVNIDEEKNIVKLLVNVSVKEKVEELEHIQSENEILSNIEDVVEVELNDIIFENQSFDSGMGFDLDVSNELSENTTCDMSLNPEDSEFVVESEGFLDAKGSDSNFSDISSADELEATDSVIDVSDLLSMTESDSEDTVFDSEIDLSDMISDSNTNQDSISSELQSSGSQSSGSNKSRLSADRQELVKLVSNELEEIVSEESYDFDAIENESGLEANLVDIAEQVENISNAIDLIGFEGLGDACRYISSNIHMLALNHKEITDENTLLIKSWPLVVISYLKNISDISVTEELIRYLEDNSWPEPISNETAASLRETLKYPVFKEEEKQVRQDKATADDMSLSLAEDVNPELLEALLQDLPVQTEEFSTAIQNLLVQKDIEYLEISQRIAHTVKGAGNVVGVKGIANLTHHLEDIFEIQSKAKKIPSNELFDVLVDAADCLETMSEALLGIAEPPDNSLTIFQLVLDWANKLDIEGASDFNLNASDNNDEFRFLVSSPESSTKIETESADSFKKPINIENMLRVPVKLADDMLRLAGENLIATSQIQEQINTIKARYKSLKTHNIVLQKLSFDLEHIVDVQGIASSSAQPNVMDDFDSLELDQYHELHSMSRRLVEISADSIEIEQALEKEFSQLKSLVVMQNQLQKENEELVLKTRMVPTKTIVARLKRGVKQACRLTNKHVDLEVIDNDTFMDSEVLNGLIEPLMHILRNSVDHGIETIEIREQSNKNSRGCIKLIFKQRGDQIVIDIEDDGKGLNITEIRSKALALGLANTEDEVTELNLQNYILQPGFSTRSEVSQISGRGIGLDVVHNKIRELKGLIEINSYEGKGCKFSLTLPMSSFSIHSLLIRVRDNVYAISSRGIEDIIYPGLGEIQTFDDETKFKLGEKIYSTVKLENMLNLQEDRRDIERDKRPIILVKDDLGNVTAVFVQAVIDSRDVVVKSMGPYVPKISGVIGATVLGDGSIAPVIDLTELKQSSLVLSDNDLLDIRYNETDVSNKLPFVLVVDDSLSARNSLIQFVEDLGFEVRSARDGMEAISLIDKRKPDLILVDMEMPRMNGLELTTHIRANQATQNMPIIMITSRSTDKHRKAALDKGVSHYMVKPFAEDELAIYINSSLNIA